MPLRLKQKKSKYRAVRVDVNGQPVPKGYKGEIFDSKLELKRWHELKLLEKAGEIRDLQRQVRIPIYAGCGNCGNPEDYKRICTYVADFVYYTKTGRIVEDSKGMRTSTYLLKKKMLKLLMGIDILETGIIRKKRRR